MGNSVVWLIGRILMGDQMSFDKSILKSMTIKILWLVLALVLLMFVLNKLFPDKIDVKPVLEQSKTFYEKAKSLFEDVPDEKDLPDVKPIGDIPTIDLVQPSGQPTDENIAKSLEVITDFDSDSEQAEQSIKQTYIKSESDNREPNENEYGSSQALTPFVSDEKLDYCGYQAYYILMENSPSLSLICQMDEYGLPMKWIEVD